MTQAQGKAMEQIAAAYGWATSLNVSSNSEAIAQTRVDPSIRTDQQALDAAFSRILSGRSPEKRGNGLKFVKQIINGDSKRGLLFLSGTSQMILGNLGPSTKIYIPDLTNGKNVPGTWVLLLGENQ